MQLRKTWSFHPSDVGPLFSEIEPLVTKTWQGYEVRFPSYRRMFNSDYASIRPERLQAALVAAGAEINFGAEVVECHRDMVVLADGRKIEGDLVFDGRGQGATANDESGFQKFVGLHIRTKSNHGLAYPILMDATVAQKDGYRFFYVLPWSANELLVEDTRYSRSAEIREDDFRREIENYCMTQGWTIESVVETESGVLPIPFFSAAVVAAEAIGTNGGYFHPVTGYSLPDSVRLADRMTRQRLKGRRLEKELREFRSDRDTASSFYYLLNRMMFLAATDEGRRKIFERFYKLPEPLIQRFYAGETTYLDRARILIGRPPVPVWGALKSAIARPEVSQ